MAQVRTLRVAPVKGMATITRARVHLEERGVAEDRRLFLLDAGGAVVTMRTHPELVRLVPDLDLDRGVLAVRGPDGLAAVSDLGDLGEPVAAELFGKARTGRVLRGEVPEAVSALAGEPLRLVLAEGPGVGWDEGPVSLVGRASVTAVGSPDGQSTRYRMLVELEGTAPYEEDGWVGRRLAVGGARVQVTHRLGRCAVITRSPATGARDWDGLRALGAVRGDAGVHLGVIAEVAAPGVVAVGDPVAPLP